MNCRSCNHDSLQSIIPLGKMPLANGLLTKPNIDNEPFYNLEVMLCQHCGLAQLKDLIDPTELFTEYVYFSSHSETVLESARALTEKTTTTLNNTSLVVEIASNDGYLLKNYVAKGINVLGIDPAQNIAKVANERGIKTLPDFFSAQLATNLAKDGKQADIIHANNVMAHVPHINDFIQGLRILLKAEGQCIIEVPYFVNLIDKLEFDTIYHEHVYYFTVTALKYAFEKQGLEIFNIEEIPLHGGSLRLFVCHKNYNSVNAIVGTLLALEDQKKLNSIDTYVQFMNKLEQLNQQLTSLLNELKQSGKKIAAYGASAKGTTLLNFFAIGKNLLDFVVDISPRKQGNYTPGTHLPIQSPNMLIDDKIDYALLLSWNFADEIRSQQTLFTKNNGKFILPIPAVEILN